MYYTLIVDELAKRGRIGHIPLDPHLATLCNQLLLLHINVDERGSFKFIISIYKLVADEPAKNESNSSLKTVQIGPPPHDLHPLTG